MHELPKVDLEEFWSDCCAWTEQLGEIERRGIDEAPAFEAFVERQDGRLQRLELALEGSGEETRQCYGPQVAEALGHLARLVAARQERIEERKRELEQGIPRGAACVWAPSPEAAELVRPHLSEHAQITVASPEFQERWRSRTHDGVITLARSATSATVAPPAAVARTREPGRATRRRRTRRAAARSPGRPAGGDEPPLLTRWLARLLRGAR